MWVPEEEVLHMGQHYRWLHTQSIVTRTWAAWASWPYLVHTSTSKIAGRSIVTHVVFVVPAVRTLVRCEPAANFIRIGPHYLGVVPCAESEPGKEIYVQENVLFTTTHFHSALVSISVDDAFLNFTYCPSISIILVLLGMHRSISGGLDGRMFLYSGQRKNDHA